MRSAASLKDTTRPSRSSVIRAAADVGDDGSVKGLEVAKVQAAAFQLLPRLSKPVGQMAAQNGDRQERHRVDHDLVDRVAHRAQRGQAAGKLHRAHGLCQLREDQGGVQEAAEGADDQAASALRHRGGGKNDEDVHERKNGVEPAGEMDQQSHQRQVQR
jgi:hypothetical protein